MDTIQFTNRQLDLEQLPKIEEVQFVKLEPDYLVVLRISFYITVVVTLAIAGVIFYFVEHTPRWVIYLTSAVLLASFVWWWLGFTIGFRVSGYAIREHDVMVRRGWLVRKTRVVPLNRVQHVSVQSGPIERRYGLAAVSVYTAGSDHADFSIRGIKAEVAQDLKTWINSRINGATDNVGN